MTDLPAPSDFAMKLASIAKNQYDQFHLIDENDEPLKSQIKTYWDVAVGQIQNDVEVPWSAVFISYCVKKAGASAAEFKFAAAHSVFVYEAINHPAAFRGIDFNADAVRVGDIIQNNRGGTRHKFAYAQTHESYNSHSVIVVARGEDHLGKFAHVIGGNEGDTIHVKRYPLADDGSLLQRSISPFICLLKNDK